jgi:Bacterial PH domain
MIGFLLDRLPDQDYESHLLRVENEQVIRVVRHHPIVYTLPVVEVLGVVPMFLLALFGPIELGWFFLLLGAGLVVHGTYLAWRARRDLFVVTDMRVFRMTGILSTRIATMPNMRILDMTVAKPLLGRMLGYGHFTFESAAQAQGLRVIRFIPDPDDLDLTIQRVVQSSGLRGPRSAMDRQMMEGR